MPEEELENIRTLLQHRDGDMQQRRENERKKRRLKQTQSKGRKKPPLFEGTT